MRRDWASATASFAGWSGRSCCWTRFSASARASSLIGMVAIRRVQAVGAMKLERTFLDAPSMAITRLRPMIPSLAAA